MADRQLCVTLVRRDISLLDAVEVVADLAFRLWVSSAFYGGSPEAALVAAVRMVKRRSLAGLFLGQNTKPSDYSVEAPVVWRST